MTHRDRSSPEGDLTAPVGSLWESWYPHASTAQRLQVFALVRQQGLIHAHQVPHPPSPATRHAPAVRLLLNHNETLTPFDADPIAPADEALDPCQRLAVARALACPDLSLIQGAAGTGKSRVLTEVLRQARRRGWRSLLIASPGGLRAALEPLERDGIVCLSECGIGGLSLATRSEALRADAAQAAREALRDAERRVAGLPPAEDVAARAATLVERAGRLHAGMAEAARRIEALPVTLAAELPSLPAVVRLREEISAAKAALAARADAARGRLAAVEAARAVRAAALPALHAQADAWKGGRWWSPAWWQAMFAGDPARRLEEHHRLEERADADHAAAAGELSAIDAEVTGLQAALDARTAAVHDGERAARREALDADLVRHRVELEGVEREWSALVPGREAPPLARSGLEPLAALIRAEADGLRAERDSCARWLNALQDQPDLAAVVLAAATVIAATPADAPRGGGFDLVLIDEAHRLPDGELAALAGKAKRCVLVGEPDWDLPVCPPPRGAHRSPPPPGAFRRLWPRFYPDPLGWPTRWHLADGRLVATLRTPTPEEAGWLNAEPVYDRPEIELRIVAPPDADPFLAEVAFPPDTPLTEAREYIYREFQTLALEAGGANVQWRRRGAALALDLMPGDPEGPYLTLEPGVRERLGRGGKAGWLTAGLEFDPSAGWDDGRARQWAAARLGVPGCVRATCLARPYRFSARLAEEVAVLLHGAAVPGRPEALHFVPVPSDAPLRWPTGAPARPRIPRGAGLETELGDPRHPVGPLPADVRAMLPGEGVVNLAEAQALVQYLAEALADPSFVEPLSRADGGGVAVLAASAAQAALLRGLITRAEFHPRHAGRIEVATAEQFRQRECQVALISLTRSHASRAVPLCDRPDELGVMVTRAARRVVLFGDPGTLARRASWFGALDHQDDQDGPREQALARQLCACWPDLLPAGESAPRPARSRESSSV